MSIHIVQPGETIYSIADNYGVSAAVLIRDNELTNPDSLVPGQTIVIVYPEQTYTVQEGDTLLSIAENHGVTVMQLLRNNPYLSDQEYPYSGDTIVISYNNNNKGSISVNGYANSFINMSTLRKTLPFLTYLSIFGYRTTARGDIVDIDDTALIRAAKEYGVAPIMLISTLTFQGIGSYETVYTVLTNEQLIDRHIEEILSILREKGYYGLNTSFLFFDAQNRVIYENYFRRLTRRLNREGYPVFVTITPDTMIDINVITFDRIDYSNIGREANGFTIMSYNWGYNFGPPLPVSSIFDSRNFLDYIVTLISPEKIDIGFTVLAYDWELPYIIGFSRATSLTLNSVLDLARQVGASIQFDGISQTPYFEYTENRSGVPIRHIVWFIDARSIDAFAGLVPEYGINGVAVWNIMEYYAQMWLVINSQYEIRKVNPGDL
jgi:spore germination protein